MDLQLGVVTVWYHGAENIPRFVANRSRIQKPTFRHIHVINELHPEAIEALRSAFPDAFFLEAHGNIGTSKAWNEAIRILTAQGANVIAIWNPDVELAENCLSILARILLGDKTLGAVAPLMFFSDNREEVQLFGGSINANSGLASHDFRSARDVNILPTTRDADYLDGGTMMLKAEALQQTGLFDERYFMYGEDSDLCLRLQRSGYRTVAIRDAFAWHYHPGYRHSRLAPYHIFYTTRNRYYFVKRHGAAFAFPLLLIRSLWMIPRRCVSFLRHKEFRMVLALVAGALCGVCGIMGKKGWVG
jgi:GT2 family glycosyltransferase